MSQNLNNNKIATSPLLLKDSTVFSLQSTKPLISTQTKNPRQMQELVMTALHTEVMRDVLYDHSFQTNDTEMHFNDTYETNEINVAIFDSSNRPFLHRYKREKSGSNEDIFKDYNIMSKNCKSSDNIKDCVCTKKIIEAMLQYQALDIINNNKDKIKLVEFCTVKYKSLLDGYIHILMSHNDDNDLDQIFDLMISG
eukprot:50660_1